jgi:hypothetical protein
MAAQTTKEAPGRRVGGSYVTELPVSMSLRSTKTLPGPDGFLAKYDGGSWPTCGWVFGPVLLVTQYSAMAIGKGNKSSAGADHAPRGMAAVDEQDSNCGSEHGWPQAYRCGSKSKSIRRVEEIS